MFHLAIVCCGVFAATSAEPQSTARPNLSAYEQARNQHGPGAADQVSLALWCERNDLYAERLIHLTRAVLVDPANVMARGLLGLVDDSRGRSHRPETLAEYRGRRDRAPETADAQWKLALWCEQNGLKDEAVVHLTSVTRLDPTKSLAWKHLGYKLHRGSWTAPEQIAAERAELQAQSRADVHWRLRLTRLKESLKDKTRRAAAEAELAGVTDRRAVKAILSVFEADKTSHCRLVVQLLGQIEGPESSRALADLAVICPSGSARRAAVETLRRRDPREFLDRLISHLDDPLRYHVKLVGGPSEAGELIVEGKTFNVDRIYSPPPLPFVPITPGSTFEYDGDGKLVVNVANAVSGFAVFNSLTPSLTWAMIRQDLNLPIQSEPTPVDRWTNRPRFPRSPARLAWVLATLQGPNSGLSVVPFILNPLREWVASAELQTQAPITPGSMIWGPNFGEGSAMPQPPIPVPIERMVEEVGKAAYMARGQQLDDVKFLDYHNGMVRKANDPVIVAIAAVLGCTPGETRSELDRWWVDRRGYALPPRPLASSTTVYEQVPLDYTPQRIGRFLYDETIGYFTPPSGSCFAAKTPVRTLSGLCPIEDVKPGDRVVTQDVGTGALSYKSVVAVRHNPPAPTLRLKIGGETIIATGIHPFWKAQKGWTMARDLRPGDLVRTLGGAVRVESVADAPLQPVFNLEVTGGHDFFVGKAGLLVHDHTMAEPVDVPFDAAPLVVAGAAR